MMDNRPLNDFENRLGKVAYDEDRQQRLLHCGKSDYAGLMTKWEDIGIYNQRIWVAVAMKVIMSLKEDKPIILTSEGDHLPLFYCENCGDREGLATNDYQNFICQKCGWTLTLN